ncbi:MULTISPECIES: glycosyltransferase family 4 protein [Prochlorococcus]|nr:MULTISPECIES: glycosyltransferase family 4 protein [Prochlorococcus]KGG14251.1 Glycosyl transferase [Prochlorococcus marinus str. LG]KGG22176.1 Glycosyl transferase [Prochlorococcus marinus str. SS2]KGG24506.1 Glycosyl transferase [Prochlorococcus marinus str. SS35]KGG33401.1 Glycosyl transferase [Prochlorococcus marinus str. SS51]KGG37317.1 Glycosyl transferase [Prochlorococcus sp. SS52]
MAGGLERQIIRTCQSIESLGYTVVLFSYDNEDAQSFYPIPSTIKWEKCGCGLKPHSSASKLKRFKQLRYLRERVKKNSISHLITFHHGLFPRTFVACLFLGVKLIVSERNALSNYNYISLPKFNSGYLSLFLSHKITVQLKTYISDYPKQLRNKIVVIPNFIKDPLPEYIAPNIESKNIAMMGRLCAQKNFRPLLDQLSERENEFEGLKVYIAGEGSEREEFEDKYSKLIHNSKLVLLGNIANIDQFLMQSAIFCFPSLWEGYPNSLVEAIRLGLPILTSKRMSRLNEFVENGVNGLIVDDRDLLDSTIYLLKNPDLLRKMSFESYKKYQVLCLQAPQGKWAEVLKSRQ